jgi:2-C-methyl-D-erythritol 2,4-cyclodiphosphate synthase
LLLKEIGQMLTDSGFSISNIDSTVVLEAPKLLPHITAMRKNISESLSISSSQVSVKATTSETLGFEGAGSGLTAYAAVLIKERTSL